MSQYEDAKHMSELSDSFPKLTQSHQQYVLGIMRALRFAEKDEANDSDTTTHPSQDKTEKTHGR